MAIEKKSSGKKKMLHHHVKHHLTKEVKLSVGLVVIVLLLVIIRLPYEAREVYTVKVTEEVERQEPDGFEEVRVCTTVSLEVREEPDPFSPFVKAEGKDHICYATIRIWNDGNQEGEWTYRYTFQLGTKTLVHELTETVSPLSSIWFEYEDDECQEGDKLTGFYELLSGPTKQDCTYERQQKYKTVTVTVEKDVEEERTVTKREPLWQKLIGYNNHEKV